MGAVAGSQIDTYDACAGVRGVSMTRKKLSCQPSCCTSLLAVGTQPARHGSERGRTVSLETSGGNLRRARTADFYVGHAAVGPTNLVHRAFDVALIRRGDEPRGTFLGGSKAGCARVAG